jgi:hypothetical protein
LRERAEVACLGDSSAFWPIDHSGWPGRYRGLMPVGNVAVEGLEAGGFG